jgi:hypothetical protein
VIAQHHQVHVVAPAGHGVDQPLNRLGMRHDVSGVRREEAPVGVHEQDQVPTDALGMFVHRGEHGRRVMAGDGFLEADVRGEHGDGAGQLIGAHPHGVLHVRGARVQLCVGPHPYLPIRAHENCDQRHTLRYDY